MAIISDTNLGRYEIQSPARLQDTLLADWTADDLRLALNEQHTRALRTQHLIFPFFDGRRPSQAVAESADPRWQIFVVQKRAFR
jgi:hypothetical protein